MVSTQSHFHHDPSCFDERGSLYILDDASVSVDQTVNHLLKYTGDIPGTVQKKATAVPYLSVKENFDLFVSKARPKYHKIDLLVEDAFSKMELPPTITNQSFDSLPASLSLRLQWMLNRLCKRKCLVIGRWLWELPDEDLNHWVDLFRASIEQSLLVIVILGAETTDAPFADGRIQRVEDLQDIIKKQ